MHFSPSRAARAIAAVAAALLLAPSSRAAQPTYGGVPPNGTSPFGPRSSPPPPSARPAPAPAAKAPAAAEPAVQFVVFGGYDIGSTKLIEATMSDGSGQSISANQGLTASVGIATLKLLDGVLATQATIGIEGWSIDASNGGASWRAYPIDVMEFAYLDPIRLGAGISYLLRPSLTGTGVLAALDAKFKDSLGLALEGDWVFRTANARRARLTLGGRYTWQKLEVSSGGKAIGASSFAILVGYTG